MQRVTLALALLALAATAAEPKEIYDAGTPATVLLERSDGRVVAGTVIDVARGWILTSTSAVHGQKELRMRLKGGTGEKTATVAARDTGVLLALLEAGSLAGDGARAVTLAPAMQNAAEIAAARVYAIGHAADPADTTAAWRFSQGLVAHVRALPLEGLGGLVLVEHSAAGGDGGPLFDGQGRLIATHLGRREDWSGLADTYFAVPVNAIRSFLGRQGISVPGGLPADALGIFDRKRIKAKLPPIGEKKEEKKKATPPPVPAPEPASVEIPAGLRFGPYTHLLESREKAELSRRVKKMLVGLYGLFRTCSTCRGKGVLKHLVSEGFWLDRETWVPPVYETKTCHTCKGPGELFNEGKGRSVFRAMTMVEGQRRGYEASEEDWLERLHSSKRGYFRAPRFSIRMHGRHATITGGRGNPLFPLHFKLLPKGRKYEWFLHVPELNGLFDRDRPAGGSGLVAEVAAADMLILEDGTIVRLCGICTPGPDGKAPPPDLGYADEERRRIVRGELRGRTVRLERDKYTQMTCDGHPLVFVRFDEQADYGAELLRRGIVRRHPKHRHSRNVAYQKAESAARNAKVGIWKE